MMALVSQAARPALPALTLAGLCLFAAPAAAQSDFSKIEAELLAEKDRRLTSLGRRPTRNDLVKLAAEQANKLDAFLAKAAAEQAVDARLMQLDMLTPFREHAARAKKSVEAFRAIESHANPMQLVVAAMFAEAADVESLRTRWVDRASKDRSAPLETRMAAATFMMTRLVEVEKGEAMFDAARSESGDDEGRALVDWFYCAAIREREDLPDGSYIEELEALAKRAPKTRYGRIAADRVEAINFRVGASMLPLVDIAPGGTSVPLRALDGSAIDIEKLATEGALLIDFFSPRTKTSRERLPLLRAAAKKFGQRGLRIVSVAFEPDRQVVQSTATEFGIDWLVVHCPKGEGSDLALRLVVEQTPRTLLIGRDGKIAAIDPFYFASDADLLDATLEKQLAAKR